VGLGRRPLNSRRLPKPSRAIAQRLSTPQCQDEKATRRQRLLGAATPYHPRALETAALQDPRRPRMLICSNTGASMGFAMSTSVWLHLPLLPLLRKIYDASRYCRNCPRSFSSRRTYHDSPVAPRTSFIAGPSESPQPENRSPPAGPSGRPREYADSQP